MSHPTNHPNTTRSSTVTIVGAGQAGLAMSAALAKRGIDHLVLERGRIAERWRSERWDSLQLLTPNWMTRLPGLGDHHHHYDGDDPDGFMDMAEVTDFFVRYARAIDAPVIDETSVFRADPVDDGFVLDTSNGPIGCRMLVAASGACATPHVPAIAAAVPARIHQTTPKFYKRPSDLPDGGVVVVGASASGIQLARELQLSGRDVTIAVGDHTRLPRRYRGIDIHTWLDMMGTLDRTIDSIADVEAARREPSLQLVGSDDGRSIDLAELQSLGVRVAGRIEGFGWGHAFFDGSAGAAVRSADERLTRMLDRIDRWADDHGLAAEIDPVHRPDPVVVERERSELDLRSIGSVLWATGYRPDYSWMAGPAVEPDGRIDHAAGVAVSTPGLYLLGLPVMRTRKSTFIDGVGADAEAHAAHIAARLAGHPSTLTATVSV
jgi:putative flavoprotein involved in K+ transport